MSKSFLSEVENDHALPGGQMLLRLAEVLGTTTDYILRGGVVAGAIEGGTLEVPAELGELADELKLSFRATHALVDARRLVIARRGKPDKAAWSKGDWAALYEKLKDYLE
jgi:transcriptional regulator with XRE-family HTH domain